jgi:hypothetical protein
MFAAFPVKQAIYTARLTLERIEVASPGRTFMFNRSDLHGARVLALALAVLSCVTVSAQSGRKAPRPSSVPATPVPSEQPTPAPSETRQAAPRIAVLVTSHLEMGVVSTSSARAILYAFEERLKENGALAVKEGMASTYSDARKLAEAGKDGYVVWLSLSPDNNDPSSPYSGSNYYDNLIIQYTVLAPVTAKRKGEGRVYYEGGQRTRTLGVPRQPLPSSRGGAQYSPERAGRETAERVLRALRDAGPTGS